MLVREAPATELTVATRILAHYGKLDPGGHVALLVGSEVVYIGGRGSVPATMTPYDLAALRLGDGMDLAGEPPDDAGRYLAALRAAQPDRAAALREGDAMVTAPDLPGLVKLLVGVPWPDAEDRARAAGALIGAYPAASELGQVND